MSTWIIISWVFVVILTAINVFLFIKLKGASEQMMKMAFPGAKNMNDAMAQMQQMMKGMGRMGGGRGGMPPQSDAQLKAAMDMLQRLQQGKR